QPQLCPRTSTPRHPPCTFMMRCLGVAAAPGLGPAPAAYSACVCVPATPAARSRGRGAPERYRGQGRTDVRGRARAPVEAANTPQARTVRQQALGNAPATARGPEAAGTPARRQPLGQG